VFDFSLSLSLSFSRCQYSEEKQKEKRTDFHFFFITFRSVFLLLSRPIELQAEGERQLFGDWPVRETTRRPQAIY
jgi:hypothetical protein